MGGFFPQAGNIGASIDRTRLEEEARRREEEVQRHAGPWWGTGAIQFPKPGGPWGFGFGEPKPLAADYAKPAGDAGAEDARIAAATKAQAGADNLKKLRAEQAASLEGVTTDLPGGGWSQTRVDARQTLPSVLKRLTLEQAAAESAPQWENDGSLGQILGDARARELLDMKFAAENERIDKEADANDPQKRDVQARALNAAADEYIAKDRGQRLPTLGGLYDTKKPAGWSPGLFEMETDAAGRETFVNSTPRQAGPQDAKAAGVAQLMESLGAAYDKARDLPEDKRTAYIQEALIRLGFGGEMMGLGKDLLSQVAKIIEAQKPSKSALEELGAT